MGVCWCCPWEKVRVWLSAWQLTFWAGSCVCEALLSPTSGTPCHSLYGPFFLGSPPQCRSYRLLSTKKQQVATYKHNLSSFAFFCGSKLLAKPYCPVMIVWEFLTLWTLRYATLLGSYVWICCVAPRTTGIVVGIPTEVLPQVLCWVPIRIKPTEQQIQHYWKCYLILYKYIFGCSSSILVPCLPTAAALKSNKFNRLFHWDVRNLGNAICYIWNSDNDNRPNVCKVSHQ